MTEQEKSDFIELKKIQVNKFPQGTIEYFQRVLKPKFFVPKTISDVENISKIEFQFCQTKEEKSDYLTIIRLQSVFDGENLGCGRNIPIIVKTDGKILGVIRMTSTGRLTGPVNDLIGWSEEVKWKGKTGGIQKLGYAQAIVPCQPFGFNCLGGKLLAMLSTSKEITEFWNKKYSSPLYGIITLSMTGGVTQYSGLKNYKYIGTSKSGRGVYFCSLYGNTIPLLKQEETIPTDDKRLLVSEILPTWKSKALNRFSTLEKQSRLRTEIDTYDKLYNHIENPFFS